MNRIGKNNHKVSLTDLVDLGEFQSMQDSFAEVANVTVRTVDTTGKPMTKVSNAPSLCLDSLNGNAAREKLCYKCLPSFLGGEGLVDDDLSFECLPGLRVYLVPLKITISETRSLIVGYIVVGPVIFMKRKSKEELEETAREVGLDPYQLWSLVLELRVFSYQGIRSLLDMIGNLTRHILTLAYSKQTMQKKLSSILFSGLDEEFLELFLELVVGMTNASRGSVMLLDKKKDELVIHASHGLPQDVVLGPPLKLGHGIAGVAAETKKSFLINQDAADEAIAGRLNRPQLFSSLIVPIKSHGDVYGVVNVSSDRDKPVKFDETNLSFVNKAAAFAGVALARLKN